jgi:hypothetical protein
MRLVECDEGFYVDVDGVEGDEGYPEVYLPDDVNDELERLRTEIKRKDRALLAAKYDRERVKYYQEALCVDDGVWACLPETGAATATINPEKLKDVLEERERLRAEVERLEKALNGAVKKLTRYELAKAARASRDASVTGGER